MIETSNVFSGKKEVVQHKVPNALVVSVSTQLDSRVLADMSNDSIVVVPDEDCVHYLNGQENILPEVSDFEVGVLNTPRVLINVLDFKQARMIFPSNANYNYDLTDAEELMEDYLELEKVLNVITINTKINLPESYLSIALHMSKAYGKISRASSRTIFVEESSISEAVYSVLTKAEDSGVENIYVYRNNALVALGVAKFGDIVTVNSVRIVDL